MGVSLVEAIVTLVEPVGMGDRVCVDLCNLLNPGEGLLVSHFFLLKIFFLLLLETDIEFLTCTWVIF